jgi:hypothetical protein
MALDCLWENSDWVWIYATREVRDRCVILYATTEKIERHTCVIVRNLRDTNDF